jgi:hypothetical protein
MADATTAIDYPIILLSQPTQTKCWWASACMILKREISKEGEWVADTGGLEVKNPEKMAKFAAANGMVITDQFTSITVELVTKRLTKGPMMICAGKPVGEDGAKIGVHSVVIAGIGDGKFHVYDPEPVGKGSEGWLGIDAWNKIFPYNAFWIFQKQE